jgi:6-methylsalicylate decarboxylase
MEKVTSSCTACESTVCGTNAMNRRRFVAGSVAAIVTTLSGDPAVTEPRPSRINVHHHPTPPSLLEPMRKAAVGSPLQYSWTPQKSLDDMDKSGITTSMLSVSMPAVAFLQRDDARRLAREANDYAMTLIADHPGRFGAYATLPMPYVEDSLKEIEYAFDTLKMDGVCLLTSYESRWLGDPAFTPVFDELNRRRAVLFIHPNMPVCCAQTLPNIPPSVVEYGADTARAITNLLFTGTTMRCTGIEFIFTHAGGAMPMFMDRYTSLGASNRGYPGFTPEKVVTELRRFYYDTALAANAPAMAAITKIAPIEQILLGTDYPLRASGYQVADLQQLFAAAELKAIESENALRLFPRLRSI